MSIFTSKQVDWLFTHAFGTSYRALTKMFNRCFRCERNICQIRNACHYYGFPNTEIKVHKIGSMRIEATGYARIKTSSNTWKYKHRIIWETANGPVPAGYIVMFTDRNKLNFNLDNLILVKRREMSYMNRFGLFSRNPDVTKTNLLIVRHRLLISDKVNKLAGNNLHYPIADKYRRAIAKKGKGRA